jgi:uncharacterized protein
MTTVDETTTGAHAAETRAADAAAADTAAAGANPALIGVPTFVIGSVALGLYLIGFTGSSANAAIGMVPILFVCTGLGQVIAALWAIRVGAGAVAAIFGIFSGFWLSFATLVVGLGHNWFGDAAAEGAAVAAQETFLLTWLIGVVVLTLASLRLPAAFTALFALIAVALLLVLLGTSAGSTGLLFGGGIAVFAFTLIGVYLFFDAMGQATGAKALPMGKPLVGG